MQDEEEKQPALRPEELTKLVRQLQVKQSRLQEDVFESGKAAVELRRVATDMKGLEVHRRESLHELRQHIDARLQKAEDWLRPQVRLLLKIGKLKMIWEK